MTIQDDIRTKLVQRVFGPLGKPVTLNSKTATTYNERGEEENVASTATAITIVPYNLIDERQSFNGFGNLKEGELDAAVPYDNTVNIDDTITMEGETWLIKEQSPNYLPGNVVTIIRLVREQS